MPEEPDQQSFINRFKNLFLKKDTKEIAGFEPQDEQIKEIIENVINIEETVVKEIMIPKISISFLDSNQNVDEIIEIIKDTRHSRYPVLAEDGNKVSGILHVKDLIDIVGNSSDKFILSDHIREVKFVPETRSVTSMLEEFKKDKAHLAIVIDEYGMMVGLVTIEDILEEIVGEIEDEFYEEKNDEIIKINDNEYIVSSVLEREKFEEFFEVNLNCPEAESLGGFMLKEIGHMPKVGEAIVFKKLELVVTSADQRKIKKITVRVN